MKRQRTRTKSGQFTPKRFDTQVSTIEKQYGIDLGVKSNMKLGIYLKQKGYGSLSEMLRSS